MILPLHLQTKRESLLLWSCVDRLIQLFMERLMAKKTSRYEFIHFSVKRFRSLLNVSIDCNKNAPVIICGENNIGKTNFLRALHIFFNAPFDIDLWEPSEDLPFHIFSGSQGGGTNSEFTGTFFDTHEDRKVKLKLTYKSQDEPQYKIGNKIIEENEAAEILDNFRLLFVKSNNVNIPELISEVLEDDILLPLDRQRTRQTVPLKKLTEFIEESEKSTKSIEKKINKYFSAMTNFDGALKNSKIKIQFAEYSLLREAVKNMISITIDDGNQLPVENKGSGAQRAIMLSLMQFISDNSKRNIIWAVDEPEVFLQPKLQKRTFEIFKTISSQPSIQVFATTHSQHFIDLENLSNTYIFKAQIDEKIYVRKKGKVFYKIDTKPIEVKSASSKASLIREHLGIENNDGWKVLPYNVMVEGEEDVRYLERCFQFLKLPTPNLIAAGGATNFKGYLQFFNSFADELSYKPKIICVFDEDIEGRSAKESIAHKKYANLDIGIIDLPRFNSSADAKIQWTIEDFVPQEFLLDSISKVLKKSGRRIIQKRQKEDRENHANINLDILSYAESCSRINNPEMTQIALKNDGRKREICRTFCECFDRSSEGFKLDKHQRNFIKTLSLK